MLRRARRRAAAVGGTIALQQCSAESLPFADGSFDHVLTTMVLCTVDDPGRALAEIRRVLVIGGTFTFIEHVRGVGRLGRVQDLVEPLWRRCVGGCRPNRRTERAISRAGLEIVSIERDNLSFFLPLIAGVARRPAE
jgi:ubiquinone/menaquinone biosynthesis C-methylase UbiE